MRLKEVRKSKGFSQLKMAMDLNTTQNTISRYETGERKLTVEAAKRIANVLDEDWVNLFDPPGQNLIARIPGGEIDRES